MKTHRIADFQALGVNRRGRLRIQSLKLPHLVRAYKIKRLSARMGVCKGLTPNIRVINVAPFAYDGACMRPTHRHDSRATAGPAQWSC